MSWMLLLVPGATALELARPQVLLPACCRIHGAHHCMATARQSSGPAWRGQGCPFANLSHAAILLAPYLPAMHAGPWPHAAGDRDTLRGTRRVVGVPRRSARIARPSFLSLTRTLRWSVASPALHAGSASACCAHEQRDIRSERAVLQGREGRVAPVLALLCACAVHSADCASATVLATVRGVVHDPSHRPIAGADVQVAAVTSQYRAKLDERCGRRIRDQCAAAWRVPPDRHGAGIRSAAAIVAGAQRKRAGASL